MGTKVYKLRSRVEFLQLYVDNLNILYKLEGQDAKVLLFIFQKISFMNTVALNASLRRGIAQGLEISLPTVSRSLNRLIEKGILKPITTQELRDEYRAYSDDEYFVDPNIVGKGSFRELEKLRYTMIKEYNLKSMEVTDTVNIEHSYAGFDDITQNIDKHEVIDITTKQIDDKTRESEILIAKKEEAQALQDKNIIDIDEVASKSSDDLPQSDSLFEEKDLSIKNKDEISEALILEQKRMKILELEVKKMELDIKKKLIDAGKIDEAMKFTNEMFEKEMESKKNKN